MLGAKNSRAKNWAHALRGRGLCGRGVVRHVPQLWALLHFVWVRSDGRKRLDRLRPRNPQALRTSGPPERRTVALRSRQPNPPGPCRPTTPHPLSAQVDETAGQGLVSRKEPNPPGALSADNPHPLSATLGRTSLAAGASRRDLATRADSCPWQAGPRHARGFVSVTRARLSQPHVHARGKSPPAGRARFLVARAPCRARFSPISAHGPTGLGTVSVHDVPGAHAAQRALRRFPYTTRHAGGAQQDFVRWRPCSNGGGFARRSPPTPHKHLTGLAFQCAKS